MREVIYGLCGKNAWGEDFFGTRDGFPFAIFAPPWPEYEIIHVDGQSWNISRAGDGCKWRSVHRNLEMATGIHFLPYEEVAHILEMHYKPGAAARFWHDVNPHSLNPELPRYPSGFYQGAQWLYKSKDIFRRLNRMLGRHYRRCSNHTGFCLGLFRASSSKPWRMRERNGEWRYFCSQRCFNETRDFEVARLEREKQEQAWREYYEDFSMKVHQFRFAFQELRKAMRK